jgi:predicted RNase H-like HicB family nuclease/predicted RNA binding protein YcfA (HicA-like mRNA interferase family)
MYQVVLIPDNEVGGFTVIVPSLPGCISEGDTEEEALAHINEAIDLDIESLIEDGEEVPEDVDASIQVIPDDRITELPIINGRECIRALQRGGLVVKRQKGSHIILNWTNPAGHIIVPIHRQALKPGTLRTILQVVGATDEAFIELL